VEFYDLNPEVRLDLPILDQDLPASGGLVRCLCGGVADWTELFGEGVIFSRIRYLSRKFRPASNFMLF